MDAKERYFWDLTGYVVAKGVLSKDEVDHANEIVDRYADRFAETTTHGTLPWKGEGERRSVLYKYASRAAARAVGKYFTPQERYGEWTNELTPEQQAVLYGPGVHHGGRLPTLESDGEPVAEYALIWDIIYGS